MQKVRWGLLSTANINRKLIPAIRASERGELVAVASRDQATAESYAAAWQIPEVYGSYDAMLASDSVDCVYIGLPNHLHANWSIKALQAGKHVLCEKPFALSVAEVDRMIAASEQSQRVLAEAFMYRHHPQTKTAGDWVRAGKLGEPVAFYGIFNFKLTNPDNVRLVPEFGGGCLWDVGVYPMSLAQFLFGSPPSWVFGSQWIGRTGIDESFSGLLHYPNGGTAHIESGFRTTLHTFAEVVGTEGRLTFPKPFFGMDQGDWLLFSPSTGEPFVIPVPSQELYAGEIEDMHAAILDQKPTYLSLSESRNHIRTVAALYQSADTARPVILTNP
jgi:predicted dehydrogenase